MSKKEIQIEKYDIDSWEKEQKPYAMILTDVIQRIPFERMREAFLWIYLESLPPTWAVNKYHIMQHFEISERTYERWMSWLNTVKLIEYRQNRNGTGSFGKGKLVVLNGSKFSPGAECNGTVKIDGTEINKKKTKVIHRIDDHRTAKFGGSARASKTRASIDESAISPNRQNTVPRCRDGHINTIKSFTKEKKKTNKAPVSVFSEKQFVKDHLNKIIGSRNVYVEEDIVDEIVYYCFEQNADKSFDSVVKRINIGLKKVREGKWNTPQGYKGITSKSIKAKEDAYMKAKEIQQAQDADIMRDIKKAVLCQTGIDALKNIRNAVGLN